MNNKTSSPFEILGLSYGLVSRLAEDALRSVIKEAGRALLIIYHPDTRPDSPQAALTSKYTAVSEALDQINKAESLATLKIEYQRKAETDPDWHLERRINLLRTQVEYQSRWSQLRFPCSPITLFESLHADRLGTYVGQSANPALYLRHATSMKIRLASKDEYLLTQQINHHRSLVASILENKDEMIRSEENELKSIKDPTIIRKLAIRNFHEKLRRQEDQVRRAEASRENFYLSIDSDGFVLDEQNCRTDKRLFGSMSLPEGDGCDGYAQHPAIIRNAILMVSSMLFPVKTITELGTILDFEKREALEAQLRSTHPTDNEIILPKSNAQPLNIKTNPLRTLGISKVMVDALSAQDLFTFARRIAKALLQLTGLPIRRVMEIQAAANAIKSPAELAVYKQNFDQSITDEICALAGHLTKNKEVTFTPTQTDYQSISIAELNQDFLWDDTFLNRIFRKHHKVSETFAYLLHLGDVTAFSAVCGGRKQQFDLSREGWDVFAISSTGERLRLLGCTIPGIYANCSQAQSAIDKHQFRFVGHEVAPIVMEDGIMVAMQNDLPKTIGRITDVTHDPEIRWKEISAKHLVSKKDNIPYLPSLKHKV